MRNPFKNNQLTINEIVQWKLNPLINPRTGKTIKQNGGTYQIIESVYKKSKSEVDKLVSIKVASNVKLKDSDNLEELNITKTPIDIEQVKINILNCIDDRDPISMNIFWEESTGTKKIVYPTDSYGQLVFYTDGNKMLRCLEKETLQYLLAYGLTVHPVTSEQLPQELFNDLDAVDLKKQEELKTVENIALDVFQYFAKISIFIDYEWFIALNKSSLLKFNYELKDFWFHNVSSTQKSMVSNAVILGKTNEDLEDETTEQIQKYLLGEIEQMLKCDKEEIKYMCNYIILGALGIVIPKIKELYPDFAFAF